MINKIKHDIQKTDKEKINKPAKYLWIIILLGGLFMIYGGVLDIIVCFGKTLPFAPSNWHSVDVKISLICGILVLIGAVYLVLKSFKIKSDINKGEILKLKPLTKILFIVCITGAIIDFIAGYYAIGFLTALLGLLHLNYTLKKKKVKYIFSSVFILVILISSLTCSIKKTIMKNENIIHSVGDTFPAFVADDIYGTTVNIEKYKGKVVLLGIQNVSQHMKRDKEEMGRSQKYNHRFYKEYKKQGLEVISITHKNGIFSLLPASYMGKKSKEAHIKHNTKELVTILLDSDGSLKKILGLTDTPLIFLIDQTGIIRYKKNGYLIVDNELEQITKKLLKKNN